MREVEKEPGVHQGVEAGQQREHDLLFGLVRRHPDPHTVRAWGGRPPRTEGRTRVILPCGDPGCPGFPERFILISRGALQASFRTFCRRVHVPKGPEKAGLVAGRARHAGPGGSAARLRHGTAGRLETRPAPGRSPAIPRELDLAPHRDAADQLLTDSPFALLAGMMLDQQYPMEHAFRGPHKILQRFGSLDPAASAAADPDEFAALCSTSHAIGTGNGTDALHLVLRALELSPGDEVVVPANTFVATASAGYAPTSARKSTGSARPGTKS